MSYLRIILVSFSLLSISEAAEIPIGTPSSQNLFLLARELYGRGLIENLEYADPAISTVAPSNSFEKSLIQNYHDLRGYYSKKFPEPRIIAGLEIEAIDREKKTNSGYLKLFPGLLVNLRENLSANIVYRIDRELGKDSRYDGKVWNGYAGFAENATIDLALDRMKFRFGFERLSWGYGRYGNLFFSRQALPMVILGFGYRTGKLDFEFINGFLSPLKEELDGRIGDPAFFTDQQRYLAAHSLTFRPFDGLSVYVREAVVYGGPGRRFEPAYAFPLIWYHGYQLNSRIDDNTLAGGGLDFRFKKRLWLYGEVLIDDIQIEKKSQSDNEPDQIAYLAGGEVYDFIVPGTRLNIEYARVNNWVYNQPRPHNRYINNNFPIGFPDGPDNDNINWELTWWPWESVRLAYFGMHQRLGEGRIDAVWSAPWMNTPSYSEPFPTGTVQEKDINGIGVLALNKIGFWGKMEVLLADINNVGNVPAINERSWEFSAEFGYSFQPLNRGF